MNANWTWPLQSEKLHVGALVFQDEYGNFSLGERNISTGALGKGCKLFFGEIIPGWGVDKDL